MEPKPIHERKMFSNKTFYFRHYGCKESCFLPADELSKRASPKNLKPIFRIRLAFFYEKTDLFEQSRSCVFLNSVLYS